MSKQPRLDILSLNLALEQDVVLEEDHRCRDIIRRTTELGDRLEFIRGERVGVFEVDVVFEDGIRELRLSGWGVWTVEYFSWHCKLSKGRYW